MTWRRVIRYLSGKLLWGLIYAGVFLLFFCGAAIHRISADPLHGAYTATAKDVGAFYRNLSYGAGESHKYDLYLPKDTTRRNYGLVVFLHAGGFTSGDKSEDAPMLRRFASKGYVAAGINYTLCDEDAPTTSVYDQSLEIQQAIPQIVEESRRRGFAVDKMAIAGGSAGGTLALIYAFRDGKTAPVPLKFVFEASEPASVHHGDWTNYGLDLSPSAAAELFSLPSGEKITAETIADDAYAAQIKNISPDMWVDSKSPATLLAYGSKDKLCPIASARALVEKLKEYGVTHDYYEFSHSGHGLQNDRNLYRALMEKLEDYLWKYMPNY